MPGDGDNPQFEFRMPTLDTKTWAIVKTAPGVMLREGDKVVIEIPRMSPSVVITSMDQGTERNIPCPP